MIELSAGQALKLMPEFECWCVWADGGPLGHENLDPLSLPLPAALADDVNEWARWWDRQYNRDDPANSGFTDSGERATFEEKGRQLLVRLEQALPQCKWRLILP